MNQVSLICNFDLKSMPEYTIIDQIFPSGLLTNLVKTMICFIIIYL